MVGYGVKVIPNPYQAASGHFFVGGKIAGNEGSHFISNQMLVEVYVPTEQKHEYPLIFFHGAGQSNLNWLQTPDGRMGWKDYFLSQGFVVYLVEQPARGRSAYHPSVNGSQIYAPIEKLCARFTSSQGLWPQAEKHTQWPSKTHDIGDECFLQFASSQLEYLGENIQSQRLVLQNGAALFERIGGSILLTHSQAGPFGWLLADSYPEYVKGIVAIEPSGPPFSNGKDDKMKKSFGIADLPLQFEPMVHSPNELLIEKINGKSQDEKSGWVIKSNCYSLPNLKNIPILILTGEASYHRSYDWLTSEFLSRASIKNTHICLHEVGINGNGHMMMMEKNNLEIAYFISEWINAHMTTK